MAFRTTLLKSWQKPNVLTALLLPLSCLYGLIFALRTQFYRWGLCKRYRAPVPVIVVGNITVGGTGKTPMVIYLVELLRAHGYSPGVISRGYSGTSESYPLSVTATTAVELSGDEAALIVKRTGVAMVVGPNRAESIQQLIKESDVDVIISDDGLQHLSMQRDVEICMLDNTQAGRNPYLLPAGPYRQLKSSLGNIDLLVEHNSDLKQAADDKTYALHLQAGDPQSLKLSEGIEWPKGSTVHAVAGIGNPDRFFNTCRSLGLTIIEHVYADHHHYSAQDIQFDDDLPVIMTEKDAVKCHAIANQQHWYLPVDAKLDTNFDKQLIKLLKGVHKH